MNLLSLTNIIMPDNFSVNVRLRLTGLGSLRASCNANLISIRLIKPLPELQKCDNNHNKLKSSSHFIHAFVVEILKLETYYNTAKNVFIFNKLEERVISRYCGREQIGKIEDWICQQL